MIKMIAIEKAYKTPDIETVALSGVTLDIKKGELIAITGPSGCGKSTLLNILGMIDQPDGGSYYFEGQQIACYNEKQRTLLRKNNIGFIFQSFNLVNELTVYENIELPLLYTKMNSSERRHEVKELMEQLRMSHKKDHYPQQLSGGQQQRVAVARAIVHKPKLLLADEPTGNLDSRHGDEVMKVLLELNEAGTTVVMVTHSEHYAQLCRKVIRLMDGSIVTESVKAAYYV